MTWLRVSSNGGIADAASGLVNALDQRHGSGRRNSRSNLATTWAGDPGPKGSATSLSGLHLGTMLSDKFPSSTTARLRNRRGNNRDDRSLELKHAGDSTATDLKTLDFPARSEFLLATAVCASVLFCHARIVGGNATRIWDAPCVRALARLNR